MKFKEGNVVITSNVGVGGASRNPSLTNELRVGNYVKLVPGERLTVEKVDDFNDDLIIGEVHAEGKFEGVGPITDAVYGDYDSRKGTIKIPAKSLRTYKVKTNNSAIAIGDTISVVGTEYNPKTGIEDPLVDKGVSGSEWKDTFVLNAVSANTPDAYVDVLHEFTPINGGI
jgi:hypothetical protein